MKAWRLAELVWVSKLRQGDWPEEFTWRGRRRKVRKIEAYEPAKDRYKPSDLRRFRLRTEDGLLCVLAHDHQRNRWTVETLYATQGGAL